MEWDAALQNTAFVKDDSFANTLLKKIKGTLWKHQISMWKNIMLDIYTDMDSLMS